MGIQTERGQVWLADLGDTAKFRPVVVVSIADEDAPRTLTTYVPITGEYRNSSYEIPLIKAQYLDKPSWANVQGVSTVPSVRLRHKIGKVTPEQMNQISDALKYALGL